LDVNERRRLVHHHSPERRRVRGEWFQRPEAVAPRITFGQRARLTAGAAIDEDHEIVILGVEQAAM